MSVIWEYLAGDTGRFAIRVGLSHDPYGGDGVTEELSASWGFFEIWVEGRNLCAQTEAGETLDAVHWYLLPLLEWLVDNWDPLLHEERLPIEAAATTGVRSLQETAYAAMDGSHAGGSGWHEWWSRHSLLAARNGGLFPEVVFRRWRDQVEISWDSVFIPGAPRSLAFTAPQGSSRLPPADVAEPLASMLGAVIPALVARHPGGQRLVALAARLDALCGLDRVEHRLAWLTALGSSFDEMLARWRGVVDRLNGVATLVRPQAEPLFVIGTPKAGLMFGAVAPNVTQRDVENLTAFLLGLSQSTGEPTPADSNEWAEIERELDRRSAPWRQGYDLAEVCAETLGTDTTLPVDLDQILATLGVAVVDLTLEDDGIRGLAVAGPEHQPVIGINPSFPGHEREEVRRFTKGHELCHILFDRSAAHEIAEASGPWAPPELEQRANAFAAMLLMPEPLMQARLDGLADSADPFARLAAVAREFRVSRRSMMWHASNLGLVPRSLVLRAEADEFVVAALGDHAAG